jgi:tetratricopeptide (TPR) repeat protein
MPSLSSFALPPDDVIPRPRTLQRDAVAAAALVVVTFLVFSPALRCGFVNFDDPKYATRNAEVLGGLSADGARWAFTAFREANWHPLTWLSLQLDASLWAQADGKLNPFGFHLTNLLMHAFNAALLFLALRSLTGTFWRSAAVALLFAVHPLRVESVAWVAERKDVLCAFFGLLALWAYGAYVRAPSPGRYLAVLAPFALSLMAKSMLVTLPFLLLVLDWWPLGRWRRHTGARLVWEKLPLFALTVVLSAVTLAAQTEHGAVVSQRAIPPVARVANAVLGYAFYLSKTVWPINLAVLYPHHGLTGRGLDVVPVLGAGLAIIAVSTAGVALRKRAPYVLAGWLWYLGALVPVIGLVQVGWQAYADRYSYLPQVGILIAVCWGVADLTRGWPRAAVAAGAAAAVVLAALTVRQLSTWRTSVTLWEHDLACGQDCPVAENNYGAALFAEGDVVRAIDHLRAAVAGDPRLPDARLNLGVILMREGNLAEAAEHLGILCEMDPKSVVGRLHLGDVFERTGDLRSAAEQYAEAIRLDPGSASGWFNLGRALGRQGHAADAVRCFEKAASLGPRPPQLRIASAAALNDLAALQARAGHFEEAAATARRARDEAAAAGRTDLAEQLEDRANRYGRKEMGAEPATRP